MTRVAVLVSRIRVEEKLLLAALEAAGTQVQVVSDGELVFRLADGKGASLAVRYNGVKPANFDSAAKAVVRGTYNGAEFIADEILLKCPSKYRGK